MKLAWLLPGTGNFYCGSCLRDHGLIRGLRALGHEVLAVPMYLPLVLDEPEAGVPRATPAETHAAHHAPGTAHDATEVGAAPTVPLFFGGINVYLQHKLPLFRHTPRWLDRLFDHPALLRLAAQRSGMTSPHELGALTLSMLAGRHGHQAKEQRRLLAWLRQDFQPDAIAFSNLLLTGLADDLQAQLGVPLLASMQGEDSFLDTLPEPWRTRAWAELTRACQPVTRFIAVSDYYGERMRTRLKLPPERVQVIHNGVDPALYCPAEPATQSTSGPPSIGYLARLCHGKGLETLVNAFIHLRQTPGAPAATLRLAGTMTPTDMPLIQTLQARLAAAGLAEAVSWHPNLSLAEKLAFLRELTVFSVPATYGEAFGLYVIEAMACGIPVVQPRHAAFPELLAHGGGLLVAPDDPAALAAGLTEVLRDPALRASLSLTGRQAVAQHFTTAAMSAAFAKLLGRHGSQQL